MQWGDAMNIHITIEENTAYLEEQVHLVCENSGYVVYVTFPNDWQEVKHVELSYWSEGRHIVQEKSIAFQYFTLDRFPNTDKITLRFFDYSGHNTNEIVLPCYNSIIDHISEKAEPQEDVYNEIMYILSGVTEILEITTKDNRPLTTVDGQVLVCVK